MHWMRAVYFCTPVYTGFLTSWMGVLPAGAPGIVFDRPCKCAHGQLVIRRLISICERGTHELLEDALVEDTLVLAAMVVFLPNACFSPVRRVGRHVRPGRTWLFFSKQPQCSLNSDRQFSRSLAILHK